jgi:pyroglutamyl-peptidase
MRLLIYGFGPYRQFQNNVTERIVRQLPRRKELKKIVFPVRFHQNQFLGIIKNLRPDVILGLGQCSGGQRLRIEAQAANKRRAHQSGAAKPIRPGGAPRLRTNLELDLGRHGRNSRRAGEYVCNYSMYVILDFLKRHQLPVRFGFIHIPHRYDEKKAMRILAKAIDKIELAPK